MRLFVRFGGLVDAGLNGGIVFRCRVFDLWLAFRFGLRFVLRGKGVGIGVPGGPMLRRFGVLLRRRRGRGLVMNLNGSNGRLGHRGWHRHGCVAGGLLIIATASPAGTGGGNKLGENLKNRGKGCGIGLRAHKVRQRIAGTRGRASRHQVCHGLVQCFGLALNAF